MHLLGDLLLLLYIFTFLNGTYPLKNVALDIEPRVVQKGETSRLTCMYEIDGAQLYTVKWYRGIHEFYRYTPSELPSTKIFFTKGIHIDLESSTEHQVVLRDVGFTLTGNFSCEVTTEEPYTTASASQDMLVVVFPETPPSLTADKTFYLIGDILRANCTSPPSRPAVSLTYFMNNVAVCEKCETKKHPADGDLFTSELTLELPLFPSHFNGNRLSLRCVAQIAGIYQQGTELKLDDTKDPVPERVTSPNGADTPTTIKIWRCPLGIFLYLVLIFSVCGCWRTLTGLEKKLILLTGILGVVVFSLAMVMAIKDRDISPDPTPTPTPSPSTNATTEGPTDPTIKPSSSTITSSGTTNEPETTTQSSSEPSSTTVTKSTNGTTSATTITPVPSTSSTENPNKV